MSIGCVASVAVAGGTIARSKVQNFGIGSDNQLTEKNCHAYTTVREFADI